MLILSQTELNILTCWPKHYDDCLEWQLVMDLSLVILVWHSKLSQSPGNSNIRKHHFFLSFCLRTHQVHLKGLCHQLKINAGKSTYRFQMITCYFSFHKLFIYFFLILQCVFKLARKFNHSRKSPFFRSATVLLSCRVIALSSSGTVLLLFVLVQLLCLSPHLPIQPFKQLQGEE